MMNGEFTEMARVYDFARSIRQENLDQWLEIVRKTVKFEGRPRLLDLGCGMGRFAIPFSQQLGYEVVAIDNSQEMLSVARTKLHSDEVTWYLQDARDLKLPDSTFDIVFISFLLKFIEEPIAALKEALRVLRPGGMVFNRYSTIEDIIDDPEHRFFPGAVEADRECTPADGEVEKWLEEAGFTDVGSNKVEQHTFEASKTRLERAGLKCVSVLGLLDDESFNEGKRSLGRYILENPDDPWLLTDRISYAVGNKPE